MLIIKGENTILALLFTVLLFHKSAVWWKFTILFSQSWQDCYWKFLQDIEGVRISWFYFQNLRFHPMNKRVDMVKHTQLDGYLSECLWWLSFGQATIFLYHHWDKNHFHRSNSMIDEIIIHTKVLILQLFMSH